MILNIRSIFLQTVNAEILAVISSIISKTDYNKLYIHVHHTPPTFVRKCWRAGNGSGDDASVCMLVFLCTFIHIHTHLHVHTYRVHAFTCTWAQTLTHPHPNSHTSYMYIHTQRGHEPCVRVWDISSDRPTQVVQLKGHNFGVSCVVSTNSEERLFYNSQNYFRLSCGIHVLGQS